MCKIVVASLYFLLLAGSVFAQVPALEKKPAAAVVKKGVPSASINSKPKAVTAKKLDFSSVNPAIANDPNQLSAGVDKRVEKVIEISTTETVHLNFEKPIEYFDIGSKNVAGEIIQENNKMMRLKAASSAFKQTNLTIQSGKDYYVFILKYNAHPKEAIYFIKRAEATKKGEDPEPINKLDGSNTGANNNSNTGGGYTQPGAVSEDRIKKESTEATPLLNPKPLGEKNSPEAMAKIKRICEEIMRAGTESTKDFSAKRYDVEMKLVNNYVYENRLYFYIVFNNASHITYDIDFMRFGIENKRKGKSQNMQDKDIQPVYVQNANLNRVNSVSGFIGKVFVFDKFTFDGKHKKLLIESWEKNGDRNLKIKIPSKFVINSVVLRTRE
jgi:conjugative transposon TraN protein